MTSTTNDSINQPKIVPSPPVNIRSSVSNSSPSMYLHLLVRCGEVSSPNEVDEKGDEQPREQLRRPATSSQTSLTVADRNQREIAGTTVLVPVLNKRCKHDGSSKKTHSRLVDLRKCTNAKCACAARTKSYRLDLSTLGGIPKVTSSSHTRPSHVHHLYNC